MDSKIKKCCPNCSQFYQIKLHSQTKHNIPLFLECGHSMCENCVSNIVKFEEPIECKICQRDMTISQSDLALLKVKKIDLHQLFPVNYFLLGEITLQTIVSTEAPKKQLDDYFIDLKAIIKSTDKTQGQCLECRQPTTKICEQCNMTLCEVCFNKTHKNFIIFKNHVLSNIEAAVQPNNCSIHKGKSLDYYCKDCSKYICMDCLVVGGEKSCKNHDVVSMQEVNDSFLENINDVSPKVSETLKRLTKTAVDVGHLLHNIENETGSKNELTQMLANVEQNFSKLTAATQKHKKEVTDIIVKLKCSEKESLHKVKSDLADAIKRAKIVVNSINTTSDPNKAKQANLSVILNEAKQIVNTPWYLTKEESDDPLKASVNEDVCSLVSDYIHLEGNAGSVYELRSTDELGPDVAIPPAPPALVYPPELPKDVRQQEAKPKNPPMFIKNAPKYHSKSGSTSSLNSADSDNSCHGGRTVYGDGFQRPMVHQVQPFPESQPPKKLQEGSQELVYVTHIVDPHNFFVQRSCHQGVVKDLVKEFRNSSCLPKPSINHVTEGKMYLVLNKADNMWQRCRVVSISRKGSSPTFLVFCIDFGSTETVTIDKLRLLPPARLQAPPPLAISCSLANCEPRTGAWSTEDALLVMEIIDNKQAVICVRGVRSTAGWSVTLEVDVVTLDGGVSVAHALAFHERARLPNTKHPSTEAPKKQLDDYFIDLKAIIKSTDKTQGQCLECRQPTTKICEQCNMTLCEVCFNKTHKNFIIFKNHVLSNIEAAVQPNNCSIHKGKSLDYYCKDCSKSICMDCLVVGGEKSCKNHDVVSMQEVNDSFLENINDVSPKVSETLKRLTKTAVDVGHLLHNIENETGSKNELTQMLANVEQNFSKLTAAVQKHKKEVTDIIVKLKCSEKESLHKVKSDLADAIKRAKIVVNSINTTSDPNKAKQANLSVILNEAKQIVNTPWYLTKEESDDPLKASVNEDVCSLVSDYIHLEGNAGSVYKLRSTDELGPDVAIPPAPPALVYPPELPKDVRQQEAKPKNPPMFIKNAPKYHSKSGSTSSLNSADSDNSCHGGRTVYGDGFQRPMVHQVQPFPESQPPKKLQEGSQELVYVTHIVDPHNFFVQRSCHQGVVKDLVKEFRNFSCLPKPSINHVTEGKMYLVLNKADNMWQRCRVVSISRKGPSPTFLVFCIDFGSTETVTIDKLRLLPPARLQAPPPLAISCSLANCEPRTGAWSTEDALLVMEIIDNKQAVICVRGVRSTAGWSVTLEVDVVTLDGGVSVAHALAFHERARLPNTKHPYPKITGIGERPKLFLNNSDFKPRSEEDVYITHIVSPDKFFVRKRHLQPVFDKLCEELDQEYSTCGNTGRIFLPEVGMACVVHAEKLRGVLSGGAWARAVVQQLGGRGRVQLVLPDCGALLLTPWSALRHIHNKFTTLNKLSTECHLAGVTPLNKKWSSSSVLLLQRFEDRLLSMHVDDTRKGSVGVTLYDHTDPDDVVCVNTEMIKHKFAVTFGIFNFNRTPVVEEQVYTNKSPLDQHKPRPVKPKCEVQILTKNERVQPKNINESELEAKDKGPLRLEAKVLHYQSPSLFYVSVVSQQKAFNELFEKIQKYYASHKKPATKIEWAVGDRCCTICAQSQTWRRAVLLEILPGDIAKVFYSDFACLEMVPTDSLHQLPDFAATMGDAAIKCHLCGIAPADGGEEWPAITKEYLKELLDVYKRVFITKLGHFKNKSMPVELWVYHTIQGGALEPNVSEWRCLNKKIVEQGLAVPDRTQQTGGEAENTDDDMLSFLKNVTGSVDEWLQLEPLPTKPMSLKTELSPQTSPQKDDDEANLDQAEACSSSTVFISDWLPPEPLPTKEFMAMPTYIDNEGMIFMHAVEQEDTLDLIRKALDVRFKTPDLKAKYAKWTVGEPCIALFFLDQRFYRGRVIEVDEENSTCIIHYVDYGNEEVCQFKDLRKSIALYQIPIQAHRCVLARIQPITPKWNRSTLDYIHKSIVEKQCFVKVKGNPVDGILPVDIKFDKLWINDHLVDFDMAAYSDGSKPVVRKFAPTQVEVFIKREPDQ